MAEQVRLVEVDDVSASAMRGSGLPTLPFAEGFPREDDLQGVESRDRGALAFFIVVDGVVVGTCGSHVRPSDAEPIELGWGLVAPVRGRGIGGQAVRLLLAEVRDRFSAATVVAHTEWSEIDGTLVCDSPASESLLRSLGFTAGAIPVAPGERFWSLDPER